MDHKDFEEIKDLGGNREEEREMCQGGNKGVREEREGEGSREEERVEEHPGPKGERPEPRGMEEEQELRGEETPQPEGEKEEEVDPMAMSIDLVVLHIFKHLRPAELRNMRLVSSLWYRLAETRWEGGVKIRLRAPGNRKHNSYLLFLDEQTQALESAFPPRVHQTKPFTTYELVMWTLNDPPDGPAWEAPLWGKLGGNIRRLTLFNCRFVGEGLLHLLNECCPTLEALEVVNCSLPRLVTVWLSEEFGVHNIKTNEKLKRLRVKGFIPVSSWDILVHFPNLEHVTLEKIVTEGLVLQVNWIRAAQAEQCPGQPPDILPLKTLDVANCSTYAGLTPHLVQANLPLRHLSIRLERSMSLRDIRDILNHYGAQLEGLQLFRIPDKDILPFSEFPCDVVLGNLVELELWGTIVTTLDFLRLTPKLCRLRIDAKCMDKLKVLKHDLNVGHRFHYLFARDLVGGSQELIDPPVPFSLPTLQELTTDYELGDRDWAQLVEWMPNLKRLEVPRLRTPTVTILLDALPRFEGMRFRNVVGSKDTVVKLTDLGRYKKECVDVEQLRRSVEEARAHRV